MKYYKLLTTEGYEDTYDLEEGRVYPSNTKLYGVNIKKLAKGYPKDWERVPKSEWLIQEAKERYPKGTVFFSAVGGDKEIVSDGKLTYEEDHDSVYCSDGMAVYYEGKWAETVSKTEELNTEFLSVPKSKVTELAKNKENHQLLKELFPEFTTVYKPGDRFVVYSNNVSEEAILAQTGMNKYCLINLKNGNRYLDSLKIIGDITEKELKRLTSQEFTKI